jgi:Family of unknown function (DUF6636)
MFGTGARCDIGNRDWTTPPKPANCHLDYGNGMQVGTSGVGTLTCAGDTALNPKATPLPYGDASKAGSMVCVSASTGMTCTNTADGHGFTISIQSYKAF